MMYVMRGRAAADPLSAENAMSACQDERKLSHRRLGHLSSHEHTSCAVRSGSRQAVIDPAYNALFLSGGSTAFAHSQSSYLRNSRSAGSGRVRDAGRDKENCDANDNRTAR